MGIIDFKLANVILQRPKIIEDCPQILYRASGDLDYSEADGSLAIGDSIDFLTYVNSLSMGKWRKYAKIPNAKLHIEIAGDPAVISLDHVPGQPSDASKRPSGFQLRQDSMRSAEVEAQPLGVEVSFKGSSDYECLDIEVPMVGSLLVGFTMQTLGATAIRNCHWYTSIDESQVNRVNIALVTTTFRKEEYIQANIDSIKREVMASDDIPAEGFHMFVVDNGRTLDAAAISDEGVTVLQNPNIGGAGGFARGMMEALDSPDGYTHVLLMDDDVVVFPESFKRTYNLLSLAKGKYRDAAVNGAMLQAEKPNLQFEDVARVMRTGGYGRIKGSLLIDRLSDVATNELIDVEVENAYGAWWYSCIPVPRIREVGLPLPVFVRCDDVEYGMRSDAVYMSMNGICVWHAKFDDRFNAAVDAYQYMRNYLILAACHDKSFAPMFLARADRTLRLYLRSCAYEAADLLISGVEDYLKGPEFIMSVPAEDLFKQKNAAAEKLVPYDEAISDAIEKRPDLADELMGFEPDHEMLSPDVSLFDHYFMRLFRTLPYDKHMLPDPMLGNKVSTSYYGPSTKPNPGQLASQVIVACNRNGDKAHVRFLDKERYSDLNNRWHDALADFTERGADVARSYRDAFPRLTSETFWKGYIAAQSKM